MPTAAPRPDRLGNQTAEDRPASMTAPLTLAVGWLAGTYLVFLGVGRVAEVTNLLSLTVFVTATILALVIGYRLKMRTLAGYVGRPAPAQTPREISSTQWITFGSALYYAVYSLSLLIEYGATGPASIIDSILNPGAAYDAKFEIYALQAALGRTNPTIQAMTLLAVLSTPLIPFLVLYWRSLTLTVRLAGLIGAGLYVSHFLFIGTQKGLGDLLIFGGTALLVLRRGQWRSPSVGRQWKRPLSVAAIAVALLVGYFAYNQADRIKTYNIAYLFEPNAIVAALTNDDIARGVTAIVSYPTHGYLGLSKNLDSPFVWTYGLGASRAVDSYFAQYLGVASVAENTYPERTEMLTGWPAGQYWATIYPWLASDLTFPGAILFMAVVGWWLARLWFEAAFQRRRLSLLLLCQLALLIAYVPANNQIGISRTALIAFLSLTVLYVIDQSYRQFAPKGGHLRQRRNGPTVKGPDSGPQRHAEREGQCESPM